MPFSPLLAKTAPQPFYIDVSHAEGVFVFDKNGKPYFDMISGIAVSNIGHRHPAVVDAIKTQVDKYLHVMVYGEFGQGPQEQLATLILGQLPEQYSQIYFVNSGTEANEAAIKLARRYTVRSKIIACKRAYHGSTLGSLSISGNEYKKYAFRPLLPDVHHITFNHLPDLALIDNQTAGVIIEPIQGDAGVRIPSVEWMHALRKKCNETGAILIFDEVQTGFGRTGKLFAFEHFGVAPDVITMAKGMGGGMPIGGFATAKHIMECFTHDPALGHITTFGGHPVNCAAALANLNVILDNNLHQQAEAKGALIESLLKHPKVKEIRRKGMLFAIEMESAEVVQKLVNACLQAGIISFWFLSCPESFRLAPPLTISEKEIREACAIILQQMNNLT